MANLRDKLCSSRRKTCEEKQRIRKRHDCTGTKAERIQDSKHWVISINAEGPQLPRQQRPEYAAAKRECQRLQDEFLADTKQLYKPIHPSKQMPNQQYEGSEDYDYVVDRKTGWKWYKEQQGNPAAYFVFVVLIMAEFLMAKSEFMVVAFLKA